MEKNNFSYAKRIKVFGIPIMFLMIIISVLTFVSAACQLEVLSGTTTLPSGNYLYDCVYVAPGATLDCSGSPYGLNISATENITIKGTVTCTSGPGGGAGCDGQPGGCNGGGGNGANGGSGPGPGGSGGGTLGTNNGFDIFTGSGGGGGAANSYLCFGGGGGSGTGYIILRAPIVDISSGTVNSYGGAGGSANSHSSCGDERLGAGGAGSAGFLMIQGSQIITTSSLLQFYGGNGGAGCSPSSFCGGSVVKGGGGGAGGRIKLFYKTALTGSPTYNVGGGSGGTGTGGAPSGGTGGTGTYYTSNGSDFNLVPNVIASYPSNGTNYYPQKGSATKVPPYYTCTTTDTPGYSDGSDLLKNVTFYLWNSTGSLLYSNTASISGLTNSTNLIKITNGVVQFVIINPNVLIIQQIKHSI
jgi:hypothetical protein